MLTSFIGKFIKGREGILMEWLHVLCAITAALYQGVLNFTKLDMKHI